jgi:methionyl aminopeptidase
MPLIKTQKEIKTIKEGGEILRETLNRLKAAAKPGVTGDELNDLVKKLLNKKNSQPSFYKFQDFPAYFCFSLNEEIVHGLPFKKTIQKGDLVSMDLGVKYKGLYTDAAISFIAGDKKDKTKERIIQVCKKSLKKGIQAAKAGNYIGDIGHAIQTYAEKQGYSVVRRLVGHSVGHGVHEKPIIPNYGDPKTGMRLKPGMCLAIEPMITTGDYEIEIKNDNFTFITQDRSLSCHFEHTIAVTKQGGEILT